MTRVAAIQMTSVRRRRPQPRRRGRPAAARRRAQGAVVAVLPENFAFMGRGEADKLADRRGATGPARSRRSWPSTRACTRACGSSAGTVPLHGAGRAARRGRLPRLRRGRAATSRATTRSTCSTSTSPASPKATANRRRCGPGAAPVCVDTPAGRLGLAVCYDLRFPELFRACWTRAPSGSACRRRSRCPTGRAHWELLLRARAIENLCHVVAPAQSGFHENGRETHGDSMIIDCWGRVLARLPRGTGVITAEIDLVRQRRLRQDFPAVAASPAAVAAPCQEP